MGRHNNNIPGFDDILFENRNRDYGAYQLRKNYHRALLTGILAASIAVSASVIIPSLSGDNEEYFLGGGGNYVEVEMESLEAPDEMIYIPPPPPPPEKTASEEILKYIPPVVVDSITPYEEKPAITDDVLAQNPDAVDNTVYSNGMGDELMTGEGAYGQGDVFFLVEVMPTFRGGGLDKFREWLYKRTNYPQAAIDKKIKGTVFLTFIVEKDGSVSNVEVLKGVDPLLDSEAVRVISESPKWTPGLQRGQPVRIRYQVPMSFTL